MYCVIHTIHADNEALCGTGMQRSIKGLRNGFFFYMTTFGFITIHDCV